MIIFMFHRYFFSAMFITHEDYTPQNIVGSFTRGLIPSAEGSKDNWDQGKDLGEKPLKEKLPSKFILYFHSKYGPFIIRLHI
jgi:hypothetical protein